MKHFLSIALNEVKEVVIQGKEKKEEGLVSHFPICFVKLSAPLSYYYTFTFYIALKLLTLLCHYLLLYLLGLK
jgi:hypothetical protein